MGLFIGIGETMAQAGQWAVMNDLFSPVLADSTEEVTSLFTPAPPWVTLINDDQVIEFTDISYEDSTNAVILQLLETLWNPEIGANVSEIDFGEIPVGESAQMEFYLDNTRTGVLEVLDIQVTGVPYAITFTPGDIYAVDDSMQVIISFSPAAVGTFNDNILVQTDAGDLNIPVTGSGFEDNAIDPISGEMPVEYGLKSIYPNPFNSSTLITFGLEYVSEVRLEVYNPAGEKVGTLISGLMEKGEHSIAYNAHQLTSGIYFLRLGVNGTEFVNKMIYIK